MLLHVVVPLQIKVYIMKKAEFVKQVAKKGRRNRPWPETDQRRGLCLRGVRAVIPKIDNNDPFDGGETASRAGAVCSAMWGIGHKVRTGASASRGLPLLATSRHPVVRN